MKIPFGLVARIPGFHPGGPGSIPGMGNAFLSYTFYFILLFHESLQTCTLEQFLEASLEIYLTVCVQAWRQNKRG